MLNSKIESILQLLSERKGSYGDVLAQIALVERDGTWRLLFGRFIPTYQGDDVRKSRLLNYEDAILVSEYLGLEQFEEAIKSTEQGGLLTLPNTPGIELTGEFVQPGIPDYLHSRFPDIGIDWPADFYMLKPTDGNTAYASGRPIFSRDGPLYPDADTAIEAEFGVHLRSRVWVRNLVFLLPQYCCRITNLSVGRMEMRIEVDRLDYSAPIFGKLYMSADEHHSTTDFTIEGTEVILPFERKPRGWMVYLLGDNGSLLDYRDFRYTHEVEQPGGLLSYLDPVDIVTNLIQGGENERVEFKEGINSGRGHEFVESVVAFANYQGGSILLGIADNCAVKGVSEPDAAAQAVESVIRDLCDPVIRPSMNRLELEGRPVIQVVVPEGKEKPYFLKDRGPYIRSGSSDRSMTRYELDEIYRRK